MGHNDVDNHGASKNLMPPPPILPPLSVFIRLAYGIPNTFIFNAPIIEIQSYHVVKVIHIDNTKFIEYCNYLDSSLKDLFSKLGIPNGMEGSLEKAKYKYITPRGVVDKINPEPPVTISITKNEINH
jgi:hypothetical protein